MHLTFKHTVENSYSFQIGDAIRECVLNPLKIPFLPLTIINRHRKIQQNRKTSLFETEFVFVIDLTKFSKKERKQFQTFFNSLSICELIIIGDEHIEGAAHHFPSLRSTNKNKRQWNNDLERLLTVVIQSSKPEKLIFIGQYPYSGVMSVVRRLQPNKSTAWLPIHAKKEVLVERSPTFGKILDWPSKFEESSNLEENSVYISKLVDDQDTGFLRDKIKKFGLKEGSKSRSKVHFVHQHDLIDRQLDDSQRVVFTIMESAGSNTTQVLHPSNHILLFKNDRTFFKGQIEDFLESVMNKRFPGPTESQIEEKAWIESYTF